MQRLPALGRIGGRGRGRHAPARTRCRASRSLDLAARPPSCCVRARAIRMPRPRLLLEPKPGGRPGPSSATERLDAAGPHSARAGPGSAPRRPIGIGVLGGVGDQLGQHERDRDRPIGRRPATGSGQVESRVAVADRRVRGRRRPRPDSRRARSVPHLVARLQPLMRAGDRGDPARRLAAAAGARLVLGARRPAGAACSSPAAGCC